jgi:hypothetical protein
VQRSMTSFERAPDGASPLENAGILLHVLNILGPGQHLFISAVSKAWRDSYERVDDVQMASTKLAFSFHGGKIIFTITSKMTLCSAIIASASRVKLAYECGLAFDNLYLQRIFCRRADVPTLQAAHELGLQLTDHVLLGAAKAASVPKLQWLHLEQGCMLRADATYHAARKGSTETLRWLEEHGSAFTADTCEGAAAGGQLHVLQWLRDQGCEWKDSVCVAAASHGHLTALQWLLEQGCPWKLDKVCNAAAKSGSVETLEYLKQRGCQFTADTLFAAAWSKQVTACHYLLEQCPVDGHVRCRLGEIGIAPESSWHMVPDNIEQADFY